MTKLGIKTSTFAMLVCVLGLVGGYVSILLAVGYVLFAEQDNMLRKTSLKVLTIMCCASLMGIAIGLLPDFISWISSFIGLFGGALYIGFLSHLCSFLMQTVSLAETVILVIMAFMAFKGKELKIGFLDKMISGFESAVQKHDA